MPGFEVFGKEEQYAINEIFDLNGGILFAHGFDALRNGVYKVREFEGKVSSAFGVRYAQAVSSGSAALRVALAAMGVGRGDQVIIPSFTFVATAEAVIQSGADLIVVDIDKTLSMCPCALENAITKNTKVIIPVHMLGAPANMEKIMEVAQKYHCYVLEDCAQGVGGTYKGKPLGTLGDIGAYSFDAGKVIITGEGGMIVTDSLEKFVLARAYHDHGHEYSSTVGRGEEGAIGEGFNYRMTELQGAIGIVQLGKLEYIINEQRKNKLILKEKLIEGGFPFEFRSFNDEGELGDSLVFFVNTKQQALDYVKELKCAGLGTKNLPDAIKWHFAKHWTHMFTKYGWYQDTMGFQWDKSADILERAIALPIMVKMTESRIDYIASSLLSIGKKLV